MTSQLMLYVHIPFCKRKCHYCDFLSFKANAEEIKAYVQCLLVEIQQKALAFKEYEISSVFIGGGTPSIMDISDISSIVDLIAKNYVLAEHAEITIECNPGTVSAEKLTAYKKLGINRISLGLQSADEEELRCLGRIHTYEEFLNSYKLAREVGFDNINIDLMEGLPGQKKEKFLQTLCSIVDLGPEHISVYGLIIEPGTLFFERYGEGGPFERELPTEEEERSIYYEARELLLKNGYHQYEISNFAKEGYGCRHNIGYWTRKEYLGLGLGASSFIKQIRYKNTSDLQEYLQGSPAVYDREELSLSDQRAETMFLGLRMNEGVSKAEFYDTYQITTDDVYGTWIRKMKEEGLLEETEERICLTFKGMDLSNYVMAGFLDET